MSKERGFDLSGLFFTVNGLNKSFAIPLPEGFEQMGFCHFCLGANYPGLVKNKKTQWCCGAWCDGLLPLLKICERFQADKKRVMEVVKKIRPTADSTMTSSSLHPPTEVPLDIRGVIIKIPVVK